MHDYNEHTNNNPPKIDNKFLGVLYEFIHSVESELDIMLPESASLQFMSYFKIIDHIISQKLSKNIIIKLLRTLDEDSRKLTKQLVPFVGYKSIKLSLPKGSANSLLLIRDKQDIFSFSIDIQKQQYDNKGNNRENKNINTIFSVNDWLYSKNVSTARNTVYCFDIMWEEKENYDKIVKEKKHSELLFDVISHDIGNYYQIMRSSLELITSLFEKNKSNPNGLYKNKEKIFSCVMIAKNALTKSQSLVDTIRRLERLYTQKDLKPILKNLPDVINNAYSTVEQTFYDNNPHDKRIKVVDGCHNPTDINIIAEDLLDDIFINLFSN